QQPGNAAHPLLQIEQALQEHGWKALDWVSLQTLGDALAQFEGMVTNWSPTGLACLRSKMAVALVERENQEAVTEPALMPHAAEARTELPGQAPQPDPAEADSDEPDAALLAAYAAFGVGTPEAETAVREVDLQL
ncbi:MAG: hypothetical protein KGL43_06575, partial [Burkholderiales bacterium]|nr:hypothetical protein [Burkholderiales bacterium]